MKKIASIALIVLIIISLSSCSNISEPKNNVTSEIDEGVNHDPKNFQGGLDEAMEDGNFTLVKNQIGDEIILTTLNLKVNNVEEKQSISSYYGSAAEAHEGFEFVLILLQLKNTTNEEFEFSQDLIIMDDKKREFNSYPNTTDNLDNCIENRKLSPGISETGYLVYELPKDSMSYSIYSWNAGTDKLYEIKLK